MKNVILILTVFLCVHLNAQINTYTDLKKLIEKIHPEISTDDKIVAFNVWSVADQESRDCNKSFDRAYHTYESAKLKGGPKGLVVIAINKDNLSSTATITFSKDGIKKLFSVSLDEAMSAGLPSSLANAFFDSTGHEIYRNIPAVDIFSSINKLITR